MRGVRILILTFSVFAGLAAMWLVRAAIETRAAPSRLAAAAPVAGGAEENVRIVEVERLVEAPMVDILVADRPIRIGSMLTPADFRWQPWPAETVSEFYITRGVSLDEMLDGAAARLPMVKDEPLTEEQFVNIDGAGVMSSLLRDGMRAASIPVSELTGAGGFINPGDFVDVMLTRQFEITHYNPETGEIARKESFQRIDTVLKTVRVLAIDQALQGPGDGLATRNLRTATIELKPEQVELIALTRQIANTERGEISLSLYSFSDLVREYGQGIDKIMPVTMLDLREEVVRLEEEAERNRIEIQARLNRRNALDEARRTAAEAARLAREEEEARLRSEALEIQMQLARAKAEQERIALEAEAARLAAEAEAAAAAAERGPSREPNRVTLLRNGVPISVQIMGRAAATTDE